MKKILNNINLKKNSASNKKFGIVKSLWNSEITHKLHEGCYNTLIKYGAENKDILTLEVPGSFELIYGSKKILEQSKLDAVVVIGSIIKGETPNFEFISSAITNGLIELSIMYKKPVGNALLTCLNEKQSRQRANKGHEAAIAVCEVLNVK